jgi:hypothetical protein
MKISEIRAVIESLNWNRHDLGGATREEFKRERVDIRLNKHIANVQALVIPPRFADDIADAAEAVTRARAVIERWQALQGVPAAVAPVRASVPSTLVSYSGRA